ncbi:MAG TPA: hypothetical protein VJ949_07970, partial [Cryomorphaceae bacterium]|nr:hypothetical protein [Cryomorphaceae bacterium]
LIENIGPNKRILDLGVPNSLGEAMKKAGFEVINTGGEDLDVDFEKYLKMDVDCVTAFEIFEHMLAPFNILRHLEVPNLVASVPLKLWFASAYWSETDPWDRHYHEFEPKQFDMLMERSGWEIKNSAKWKNPEKKKLGIRPILRNVTDRYYIVHCQRQSGYTPPSK